MNKLTRYVTIGIFSTGLLLGLNSTVFASPSRLSSISDVSGAAYLDDHSIITVSDVKRSSDRSRLHIANIENNSTYFTPVTVVGAQPTRTRSHDLESVCPLPGKNGHFLISESGYYKGQGGRVFEISITRDSNNDAKASCVGEFKPFPIPPRAKTYSTPDSEQIEGIEAIAIPQGGWIVLFGQRGNAKHPGKVIYGYLQNDKFTELGRQTLDLRSVLPNARSCSDLHIIPNPDGQTFRLFAAATTDVGDLGPFESVICEVGTFSLKSMRLTMQEPETHYRIDGLKVEAIGKSPEAWTNSDMFYGTDCEGLGGIVRPLKTLMETN